MIRKVYLHMFASYGKRPGIWFAFTAEAVRAFIGRVVTVVILAEMVASISAGNLDRARQMIFLWLLLTLVSTLFASAGELVGIRTENHVYAKLLENWYKKLTNKDMAFYRNNQAGYLSAMFRQYLDGQLQLIRLLRGDILRTAISLAFPAIVLIIASWKVGLVAILLVVTQAAYMIWSSRKADKYRQLSNEVYRQISGEVADDITNIVAYKSAGKELEATKRIADLRKKETNAFWLRRKTTVLLDFPRNIVTTVLVALAFWLALNANDNTAQTIGLLVLTITYMFQILRNVADLPDIIYRHDDIVTRVEPTMHILERTDESIKDSDNAKALKPSEGCIEFQNVHFEYRDNEVNETVFSDFSLTINGGEKVGIVGLSGAGKSTLASLLMRFDDISSGKILVDGIDIRKVTQSSLRQKIAYVPQEPLLFHRSIRENIAYHNDEANDKDIIKAAKAAHAHEFIKKLANGYDTVVGERGVKLSGGQKQRIVIARAVLKHAPILLFDEATSALDSESEQIIQGALPRIIGSHTAIIIAHRLSTLSNADRIIVLHDGEIVEDGTHEQLLKQKGRYADLWQRQHRHQ